MKTPKSFLFILALLFASVLTSCSEKMEDIPQEPTPAESRIISTEYAYSEVPGFPTKVFQSEIQSFSDGSVDVTRSVVPRTPAMEVSDIFVSGAGVQATATSESFSFPNGGWYIPADPANQAIALGGGTDVEISCFCDAAGNCTVVGICLPSGTHRVGCVSIDCTGNCDAVIVIRDNHSLQVGDGIFLSAANVQIF